MRGKLNLTPWARDALAAVEINRFVLLGRIPDPWVFRGHARSSRGPWTFELRDDAGSVTHSATLYRLAEIPAAIERLLSYTGADTLEQQLAASLLARQPA